MKALQVLGGREFTVLDVPTPVPGPGEVRVRVDAVTICTQWDLHLRHDDPMYPGHRFHYPYTVGQPGHEASGVIDALGDGVSEFALGDRVSVWRDPGHDVLGAYAQFMVRPIHDVILVPELMPAVATAPFELAMCVACAVLRMREMNVIAGRRLAVCGLGPAGLIGCQMLRAEGAAEVIGIDPSAGRRELARSLGCDQAWSPEEAEARLPLRPEAELDSGLDCVGAKRTVEFLMDRVRDTVQLFGVQREDYTFSFRHYLGVRLCGYPPHRRAAARYAVGLLERGHLDLAPLVTHTLPFDRYAEALDLLERQEAVKVALVW